MTQRRLSPERVHRVLSASRSSARACPNPVSTAASARSGTTRAEADRARQRHRLCHGRSAAAPTGGTGSATTPDGDYTYQGTQLRFGITQTRKKTYGWQLEFEVPFMVNLPSNAVEPPPQGQLGLGAAYYAANSNSENPAHLFLKQGTVRFKGLGGIAGQSLRSRSLRIQRRARGDARRNASIVVLNRDRVSQRILGNFGFSDVLRSLDGAQYTLALPKYTITGVAARPTEGVFQVNGWNELDINVFYGSAMGNGGTDQQPAHVARVGHGLPGLSRQRAVKTDNRPAAARNADTEVDQHRRRSADNVVQLAGDVGRVRWI